MLSNGVTQTFDTADDVTASTAGGGQTFGYDGRGNLTSILPTGGAATTLTYDQADRLTAYGSAASYAYNGDGMRMSKTLSGVTQHFAWDTSGALLSDGLATSYVYGPTGAPVEQMGTPWLVGPKTAGDTTSTSLTVPLPA